MNDVKLDLNAANVPKGRDSGGHKVASSQRQPDHAQSSEAVAATAGHPAVGKDDRAKQAESVSSTKEKQSQQQQKVQEAVARLNDYIQSVQRDLEFNMDEESGRVVVKVVDRKTNETIRQIPDEMALKLARNLQSDEPISLLSTKA